MYHAGVGADPDLLKHLLGGSIGLGLKQIVLDAYSSVVKAYEHGDDIFALGFFKGCICCAGTRGNDRSFGNRAA
jgi:uncharacterized protein (DUF2235 family)